MNIRELLQPQFVDFKKMHVKLMSEKIEGCIANLKANGNNLSAFNDQPEIKQFIKKFTTSGKFEGLKWIVEVDEKLVQKILLSMEWIASKDCGDYAEKLEQKILQNLHGDSVASLTFDGNLWKNSTVEAIGSSGRILKFKTNAIQNKSKFGKYFFQFPTRISHCKQTIKCNVM